MSFTESYVAALQREYATGKALEHAYRTALKNYLEALHPELRAVNEAKKIEGVGIPDIVVFRPHKGEHIPLGYIETKDVTVGLDKIEASTQMTRYLSKLDNVILTNNLQFRFYRDGVRIADVTVAEVDNFFTHTPRIKGFPDAYPRLELLLHEFVAYSGQTISSAQTLAEMMARKAQLMRNSFFDIIQKQRNTSLHTQLEAFKTILIHDLSDEQFADMYAQTIAYGLFTARLHDETLDDFSRAEARDLVPRSNPFLRRLFDHVCGLEIERDVIWSVDALCEIFRATNIPAILSNFGKSTGRNDPVIHFYETFLGVYDPKLRKSRGVWYTPEPIVNFIVRAVDDALQTHFHLSDGLADTSKVTINVEVIDNKAKGGKRKEAQQVHKVQLLDVAAGTGTFTAEAIKQIHARFSGQQGMWNSYVEEHLFPRLHGFEILMASYAMCHMKIDLLLTELGYKPTNPYYPPRLNVYLTNALEEHHPDADTLFASFLATEANAASRVKRDIPIMVAYGNPPYSVSSQNKGKWIQNLVADYKAGLKEKNINPLSDDYIKFIRNAEHYVQKTGHGIVAMITNNSFLDGIIHRQMRKHLLTTFDHIYIVDLHGSAKKKETAPDASVDKNVFDIQQGVSIAIMIKDGSRSQENATVHHHDLYGARMHKYRYLWDNSLSTVPFTTLQPTEPYFFFVPKDFSAVVKYEEGFGLNELFTTYASGIKTERDHLTIQFSQERVEYIISELKSLPPEEYRYKYREARDGRDWKISTAKVDVVKNHGNIIPITYRPFDTRFTYYTGRTKGFLAYPRLEVNQHMLQENYCLLTTRQTSSFDFQHAFVMKSIADMCSISSQTKETGYQFPLYLYSDKAEQTQDSLEQHANGRAESKPHRTPNLNDAIVATIAKKLKLAFVADHEASVQRHASGGWHPVNTKALDSRLRGSDNNTCFTPLDLLDYIYAVLHSPTYRTTYREFLKIDFPRIPYPDNAEIFWQLVTLGGEMRSLHLMEHPALSKPITQFPEEGDCMVEKPEYKNGRVYINATQFFDSVPELAWNFYIGGYQPAQKWLKDRKGRALSYDDIRHYQKIIVALVHTDSLMQEIDAVLRLLEGEM